jgi:hypothetical protein
VKATDLQSNFGQAWSPYVGFPPAKSGYMDGLREPRWSYSIENERTHLFYRNGTDYTAENPM